MDITPADVASAWSAACQEYGAVYHDKASMPGVDWVGEMLARVGVISQADWARASTTVPLPGTQYSLVLLPDPPGEGEPLSQLRTISHELTHARQWQRDGYTYPYRYLTDEVERASYEAYAQYAAAEILWWARGERLDVDAWEQRLQRSYACSRAAAAHGAAMLTQHLDDTVCKGARSSAVAQYLIRHIEGRHR